MAASSTNKSRPLANFHPTVWGYHFLSYTHEITNQEKVEVDEYKETIRKMLMEAPEGSEQKLVLIDAMQRLGVAYHFHNEIETSIQNIFDASKQNNDDNLHIVSLRFRLVRQQGHYISSDVFKKFTEQDGKFKDRLSNDVQGILSLYEASHLRVRDEEILEEALTFTTTHLESIVSNLSNNNSLKVQVSEALTQPIRMNLPRIGARKYISIYENNDAHNHLLLKFAKLDFNMLQKFHQRELSDLTRWWKDLDFANKIPYARDRLVECYFWTLGVYFEPKYSRARKMMTKVLKMTSIIDDTFDAYANFDELVPFNDAIQRWDANAIDSIPPYMRPIYQALLDIYSEMEQVLSNESKLDRVYYAKYEMKKLVRAYFKEAQWLNDDNHIPKYEEHMENAIVSAGYMMGATNCLVGVEEFISKETFEWLMNEPVIVLASSLINRAMDDIVGHEEITNQEKVEVNEYKERIRKMLVEAPEGSLQKLVLIDAMQRLGVAYHFDNEIETSIQNIFDASKQNDNDNLYFVSLRFRLVRQQGHYMSSDVFKQFTNQDGKFKETLTNDVQGLLSLYEASHLRVRDEEILEEALTFTTTHLESIVSNISNNNSLKVEVSEALTQPIRMTLPRMGARKYISIYENNVAHNHVLLKFAKLDFNVLQKLHQRELNELTRWWKDLDFANKIPYARDRLVECYFWILGVYFEPKYSHARKMMTKVLKITSVIDDTFDAYATYDELVAFTDAIQRWDANAIDSISPYMRPLYQALLDIYSEMEQVLSKEGKSDRVYYGKNEIKKIVRAYFKEAQWLNDANYIPKYEEHMEISLVTAGYMMGATNCLMGVEEFISKDTFEWLKNEPLIVRAASLISRAMDDIVGHEDEQKRGHVASIIECYMKEYGASKQEAYAKFKKDVTNVWKDINKEFFRPTEVPMFVLERALNFARVIDTLYQEVDGYTNSKGLLKDLVNSLLIESVKISI